MDSDQRKIMGKITIQGIQYDVKSSYQQGPKLAPPLIREALHAGSMNLFNEDGVSVEGGRIVDRGDFGITDYFTIEKITKTHLKEGGKVFTLGGDHSITYPIIKAHQEQYPKLDMLHIDAHADLYDNYEGTPIHTPVPLRELWRTVLLFV